MHASQLVLDIDECLEQLHTCNGTGSYGCVNVEGDYKCRCKDGFRYNQTVRICQGTTEIRLLCDYDILVFSTVSFLSLAIYFWEKGEGD